MNGSEEERRVAFNLKAKLEFERMIAEPKLAEFGRLVLEEIRARGHHEAPERDADGYEIQCNLARGLARDGFLKMASLARSKDLFKLI